MEERKGNYGLKRFCMECKDVVPSEFKICCPACGGKSFENKIARYIFGNKGSHWEFRSNEENGKS